MSNRNMKEFSKALAEALLENDSRPMPIPSAEETYRSLCYYDPQVQSDEALIKLSKAKQFPPLCNGFINGLIQCSSRNLSPSNGTNKNMNDNKKPATGTSSSSDKDGAVNGGTTGSSSLHGSFASGGGSGWVATSTGFAEVAFVVFLKRPLELLQKQQQATTHRASQNNLEEVRQYLGNYDCCFVDDQQSEPEKLDETTIRSRMSTILQKEPPNNDTVTSENVSQPTAEDDNHVDHSNKYEEIFAAESDASDYDYGEGAAPQQTSNSKDAIDEYMDSFSLEALTKLPESPLTWSEARYRLIDLLRRFDYSYIAALSNQRWRELGVSKALSDLAFMLLLHQDDPNESTSAKQQPKRNNLESLVYNSSGTTTGDDVHGLRMLWSQFVYVLRDRVLDETMVNADVDALIALIIVLKRLFVRGGELNQLSPGSGMSPSLSVTLLCLSSVCSSVDICRSVRKNSELLTATTSLFPSLAIIAEAIRPSSTISPRGVLSAATTASSSKNSSLDHLSSLSSIIEFLAGVDLSLNGTFKDARMTPKIASSMISSGFFREIVLLYGCLSKTAVDLPQKIRLLRSIFTLCAQANKLFDFASRVPTFADDVFQSDSFFEMNPCDATLWSLLAFAATKSGKSVKGYSQETCANGFDVICERTIILLEFTNSNSSSTTTSNMGTKENRVNIANKDDILFFSNVVASCPRIATTWRSYLDSTPMYGDKARTNILTLRKRLEEWKPKQRSTKPVEEATEKVATATPEDDDLGLSIVVVDSIRKAGKLLSLILDEKQSQTVAQGGVRISSKTD